MKKLTFLALCLGSTFFANAQVGIGTKKPANASLLDIVAEGKDKGILIPRVQLDATNTFAPIKGDPIASLLVYNLESKGTGNTAVTPGFYYWVPERIVGTETINGYWEKITNQSDVNNLNDIISLLRVVYPSNNLSTPINTDKNLGGGMVFTPGNGTTNPQFEYVYFDGTNYVKQNITKDIIKLLGGSENETFVVKATNGTQYYVSEKYILDNTTSEGVFTAPNQAEIDAWTTTTVPSGVYQLEGSESETLIVKAANGTQYYISEKYIVEHLDANGDLVLTQQTIDGFSSLTTLPEGVYQLKGNESETLIVKATNGKQYYISEKYVVSNLNNDGDLVLTQQTIDGFSSLTTLPEGVYQLKGNESETLIVKAANGTQYYISEKYIVANLDSNGDLVLTQQTIDGFSSLTTLPEGVYQLKGNESETFVVKATNGTQYYISEEFIVKSSVNGVFTKPTQSIIDAWTSTSLPSGVYKLGGNESETYFVTTSDGTRKYYISEKYILDEIAKNGVFTQPNQNTIDAWVTENAKPDGVYEINPTAGEVKIVLDGPDPKQATFQIWNNTTKQWVNVDNTAFKTIVDLNETETVINKTVEGVLKTNNSPVTPVTDKIIYEYLTENKSVINYLDITGDIEWSIKNNEAIQKEITKLLDKNGNVYYTKDVIAADSATGQLEIPAESFYTINPTTQLKEEINIAQLIVNTIKNATPEQKQDIKDALGNALVSESSVLTGDTYEGKPVRRGVFTTNVLAGDAETSGITLDVAAGEILSITVKYGTGLVANVTDVVLNDKKVDFNIGVGNMYTVLGSSDIIAKVIIEFAEK